MNNEKLNDLAQFSGTENYWRHMLGLVYTDGVRYVAEEAGAYWLLDILASYQPDLRRNSDTRLRDLQFWKLTVNPDHSAVVTCRADSDVQPAVTQEIGWTDFPLPEIEIWVARDEAGMVAMLPTEW